ncbi:MAG: hypothetical protein H6581_25535 [Bacteroidia bacterium]|nr:hypothetical protein [Bacteroidia bacterium]
MGFGFFPDYQVWDLKSEMMRFCLPRLKKFRNMVAEGQTVAIPDWMVGEELVHDFTEEELKSLWISTLDDMIFAFGAELNPGNKLFSPEEKERINQGLVSFGKHYIHLWD